MYRWDLFHIESKIIYQNEERPLEVISWPLPWYGIQLNHIGYGLGRNELLTFEEKFIPQGFIVESNLTWYS